MGLSRRGGTGRSRTTFSSVASGLDAEKWAAREHLVKNCTEGIDIRCRTNQCSIVAGLFGAM